MCEIYDDDINNSQQYGTKGGVYIVTSYHWKVDLLSNSTGGEQPIRVYVIG